MANRVTSSGVTDIIDTDINVTPFINTANMLVTKKLGSSSLSSDQLTEIERWLAAHLVAIRDPREKSIDMGDAGASFEGKNSNRLGLRSTQYGQTVIELDTTGTFAKLGQKTPSFSVLSESD